VTAKVSKKSTRKPTTKKKTRGRPRIYPESCTTMSPISFTANQEIRDALEDAVKKANKGRSKYLPPITRNALIKALLAYGMDNLHRVFKNSG